MKLYATSKTKAILTIAVITAYFGAIATFSALHIADQAITRIALRHTEMVVAQQKAAIELVVADSMSFAQHLGQQQNIIDYMQSPNPQEQHPALLEYLHGIDAHDRYQAVYIMNKEGRTLLSTDHAFAGQNYGFRTYFKQAIAGEPTIDAAIGVTSGKFGYYFSHPIKTESGEIIGVAVAKLKDTLIADALKPKDLSKKGGAMLVDAYGVVIQSSRPDLLFKSLGTLSPEVKRIISETRRFSDIDITSLGYDQVAENVVDRQKTLPFALHDTTHKERNELIGVADITNTPFFIVITEAHEIFTDAAGDTTMTIGLFMFMITAAMATILTLLSLKHLSIPS